MNVADYKFPIENLVVYFFNPFGRSVMETVLTHLDASIDEYPRDVIVVILTPEFAHLVAGTRHLHPYKQTPRYHIYRTGLRAPRKVSLTGPDGPSGPSRNRAKTLHRHAA
jgi:hypothetical protein